MEGVKEHEHESSESSASGEEQERTVCAFHLEGKCRFGDKCKNLHPDAAKNSKIGEKKKKKSGRNAPKEDTSPKSPMKTALDVIHRIQWDSKLPAEFFTIGYTDRFKGVMEEQFSRFSNWCDLASAEQDALAIPQHRIQYFKYKDTKVWDKNERIDEVFGSTGSNVGIINFVEQIDQRIRESTTEAMRNQADAGMDSASDSDSDFSSSEDEDGVRISIAPIRDTESSAPVACLVPEEERSTHFLAIRVHSADIVNSVRDLQLHIVQQEQALAECTMKLGLLHITIGMLRLSSDEGISEAMALVEDLQETLNDFVKQNDVRLRLEGLDTFGQRVLFAKVVPEPDSAFWEFIAIIKNRIALTSANVMVTNKFEFTPHLTIVKVSRPVARTRNSKYLPSALYEKFVDHTFGQQKLDNLNLCVIESSTRHDGFYRTLKEITFN